MTAWSTYRRLTALLSFLALGAPFWRRSWKHRVGRTAVFGCYCYVGVLLVLLALENWFLFHPYSAKDAWDPPPPGLAVEDVALTSSDGTPIHAWWAAPPGWEPRQGAVIICHGNAGNLSWWGDAARLWEQQMKVAVLLFDYPGYGRSGGRPTEAGCYAAGDAAYDWLTGERKVPGERVLLYGESLGGAVAIDLAARRPHRALFSNKAFTSIPDMAGERFPWLPARWLVRNKFDNLRKLPTCARPVFMAHGTADPLVPFAQAQRLFAAAPEPKEFYPVQGGDHDYPLDVPLLSAFARFLERAEN
jgi:fermentation-respiration switch protein FrsA (DUF1100 family)